MDPIDSGLIADDHGTTHWLGGISVRAMLTGRVTGGGFSLVEHRLKPRELAAPLHLHTREDEYSLVTDGHVGFVLGDDTLTAGPGSVVRKPRGQWHTFFNAGDIPARLLELISPAGLEAYFEELVPLLPPDGPPDIEAMAELSARYGLEIDFGSLPGLVERFGLAGPPEAQGPR